MIDDLRKTDLCSTLRGPLWESKIRGARRAQRFEVLVAQWIAHQTSNLGVAGSNPVEHVFEWAVGLVV